ncbi:energy transducer TonB [Rubrivirga litoralis]|uniref:Energy transducer TonB n=1 Tax=Rubrivirga litoralis TaxID=3075598 RepID=A0ABU3BVA5_9BACT|nr:energy transducer TonB [Rubrivirga sp. F394]MDT0633218.1 energy transducer TonB [Rubrivirga sp. F394]
MRLRLALAALLLPALAAAQTDAAPPAAPTPPADSAAAVEALRVADEMPRPVGGIKALYGRIVYPEAARQDGVEGQVFVEAVVDEEGRAVDAVVLRSPDDRLSDAALTAVRASPFVPGRQGGAAARVWLTVPVTFKLQAPEPVEPEGGAVAEGGAADGRPSVKPQLIGGLESLQRRVEYPESAWRAGVEGTVVVEFVVDEMGVVVDPVVVQTPDRRLNEAALQAVRTSLFVPGAVGGEPTPVRFSVPIRFRLHPEARSLPARRSN